MALAWSLFLEYDSKSKDRGTKVQIAIICPEDKTIGYFKE